MIDDLDASGGRAGDSVGDDSIDLTGRDVKERGWSADGGTSVAVEGGAADAVVVLICDVEVGG